MVQLTLPKNSKVSEGKNWPSPKAPKAKAKPVEVSPDLLEHARSLRADRGDDKLTPNLIQKSLGVSRAMAKRIHDAREARAWRDLEARYRSVADEDTRDCAWLLSRADDLAKIAADYEAAAKEVEDGCDGSHVDNR